MPKPKHSPPLGDLLLSCGAVAIGCLTELMQNPEVKPELRAKVAEGVLACALKEQVPREGGVGGEIRFEGVLEEWSR